VAARLSARQVRIVLAVLAIAGAGLAQAAPSQASIGSTSSCYYGAASHPFAPWGDPASYTLVPGGSFEAGAPGWTLAGGARVVYGNESFFVRSPLDRYSLAIPAGSSATTAPFCVSLGRPTIRFFVANGGSSASHLRVRVVFRGLLGILGVLDGGTITAGRSWNASPVMLATLNAPLGTRAAQFVFTPTDSLGAWRIDDLYVDPWVNL
jgi:hypothetical protein